jgi:glycosyltransferase involved in cell wall biosynthesis
VSLPFLVVVTTLGRVEPVRRLLESVAPQLTGGDRLVIVAQGSEDGIRALADEATRATRGQIMVTTSSRGASLGRNAGVAFGGAGLEDALVMFPNDTTWFPDGTLASIRERMDAEALAGAVTVMTPSGPRFELPAPGTPLDRRSVWQVIEMSLIIRLPVFRAIGGFDESIGTGAPTPWQAGEVTDLLLRALHEERTLARSFHWVPDEEASVRGVEETAGLTARERRWKLRAYGRGIGRVYSRHPFPLWRRWGFVVAGLFVGMRRPEYELGDGFSAFLGRLEGLIGRPIGRISRTEAVAR